MISKDFMQFLSPLRKTKGKNEFSYLNYKATSDVKKKSCYGLAWHHYFVFYILINFSHFPATEEYITSSPYARTAGSYRLLCRVFEMVETVMLIN